METLSYAERNTRKKKQVLVLDMILFPILILGILFATPILDDFNNLWVNLFISIGISFIAVVALAFGYQTRLKRARETEVRLSVDKIERIIGEAVEEIWPADVKKVVVYESQSRQVKRVDVHTSKKKLAFHSLQRMNLLSNWLQRHCVDQSIIKVKREYFDKDSPLYNIIVFVVVAVLWVLFLQFGEAGYRFLTMGLFFGGGIYYIVNKPFLNNLGADSQMVDGIAGAVMIVLGIYSFVQLAWFVG